MKNEFELAFKEIAQEKGLDPKIVIEAIENALISAYRKDTNASLAQQVEANVDPGTGRVRIFVEKEVVDDVQNPYTEVELEKARYFDPEANYGDMVMVQAEGTTKNFGRIAAQTAKQVILQKIREAERNALYDEYVNKEGEVINATVQASHANAITVNLGARAEATLPKSQQIHSERLKVGEKVRVYVLEVKKSNRGPQIVVSRSHRNMLKRLLEYEVPEIFNGQVEIKNIAREAGGRSKVAVAALQEGIDPVGACVGMRGIRIQNIVKELHDEKIDVIEWSPDQEEFISKALSPARVNGVYLEEDPDTGRTAVVIVPDDQLSLAIGREGQNARLAAKLTSWRIDIKNVTESVTAALEHIDESPLAELVEANAELYEDVKRIMEKKNAGLTVMPEDYRILASFADLVERTLMAAREEARRARQEEINAVKLTLPQHAFEIPIERLNISDELKETLSPLENAGEIMLRMLIDEQRLFKLLNGNENALLQIQEALDEVVYADDVEEFLEESEDSDDYTEEIVNEEIVAETTSVTGPVEGVEVEEPDVPEEKHAVEGIIVDEAAPEEKLAVVEPDEDEDVVEADEDETVVEATPVVEDAFPIEEYPEDDQEARNKKARKRKQPARFEDDSLDMIDDEYDGDKKRRKKGKKGRQLIYDEDLGEVVVKRRRKGGRKRESWDDEF